MRAMCRRHRAALIVLLGQFARRNHNGGTWPLGVGKALPDRLDALGSLYAVITG